MTDLLPGVKRHKIIIRDLFAKNFGMSDEEVAQLDQPSKDFLAAGWDEQSGPFIRSDPTLTRPGSEPMDGVKQ